MAGAFTLEMLAVDAYHYTLKEIAKLAVSLGKDPFLDEMDDEQLTDYWLDAWLPEPLEWDVDRPRELSEDENISVDGSFVSHTTSPIRQLFLPVISKKSNARVLALRPEQGWIEQGPSLAPASAYHERDSVIVIRGTVDELKKLRTMAENIVHLINEDVTRHYGDSRATILSMIRKRRAKLASEAHAFERETLELAVQIRRRQNAPRIVDVRTRKEIKFLRERPRSKATATDRCLSPASMQPIIDLIHQAGTGFELARKEFRKLGEKGLRHIIAIFLNAVFESNVATAETFSKDGKADLFITVDGRAVLVGECKFWDGRALYTKTLGEQLTRYVLWRHSAAVLVTFSDRQSLTAVMTEAKLGTEEHASYRSGLQERSETYFVSTHEHPDDPDKTMEIHHLFFNLYSTQDEVSDAC
jgi:hypothetical protein